MTPSQLRPSAVHVPLVEEIRSLGGVWMLCDERGNVLDATPPATGDFTTAVLTRSRPFQHLLRSLVPALLADASERIAEPLPGLFVIPSRLPNRRFGTIGLAVVPTAAFAYGEDVTRMSTSIGLDPLRVREAILAGDPPTVREVNRVAPLVRFAHRADAERASEISATESVGAQLAETYEEINLLYTLVSGMAVTDGATPLPTLTCSELVRVLGFSWVAVRMRPPLDRFAPPDGVVFAGNLPVPREALRDMGTRLLMLTGVEAPRILPRGHPTLVALGVTGAVVACPVRRDGVALGILIAGERRDRGGEITGGDVKLADAAAGHLAIHFENAKLYGDLDAMFVGTLEALVAAIDAKDPYTRGHSQRVAALSRELTRAIGVPEPTVRETHLAGLVHDVGKIGVPGAVLRKPGQLTEEEFAQIRMHPEIGWRILKDIPQFRGMLDGVLSHHERWDGRGYPHGLSGSGIPLIARIIGLADSFDAMSSNRTYRAKRPRQTILGEIRACAGAQFDPELVGPFLALEFAEYDRLHAEHEAQGAASAPMSRKAA